MVKPFIYGIKPAILSVIVATMISLGKKAVKSTILGVIGILSAAAVLYGVSKILVFFTAGTLGILLRLYQKQSGADLYLFLPVLQIGTFRADVSTTHVFWIFLKIGSILYGSGYVLFAL